MSQSAGYTQPGPAGFPVQAPYYTQHPQSQPSFGYNGAPPSQYSPFATQSHGYPPQYTHHQQAPQQVQSPSDQQLYQSQPQPQPQQQQQQQYAQTPQDPAQSGQQDAPRTQVDKATDPLGWALAQYGSPFAYSKDWRATPSDVELTGLPQQKLALRIKQRFARSPGDVWSELPPSFGRPPQQGWSYAAFQPFSLPVAGEQLADGFKPIYIGRVLADHDVSAADWARFLEDISVAGRMTGGQQIISQVAPITMHLGATGYFVTKAIEKRMKNKKAPVIAETIEMWQQNFFLRRGLDVYVQDTTGRITGYAPGQPLPGSNSAKPVELEAQSGDDSDDDSSDSDAQHAEKTRKKKKQERRERKKKRREEKKQKRKDKKKPQFYLIVAPYQPM